MSENTGIWLPEAVLSLPDLTPIEKMLFAMIIPMTFEKPCWAGNEYLAKRIGVSEQTVSNNLSSLHEKGYVRVFVDKIGGNVRSIHTYILESTLYKYLGKPLSKFDRPLYKDFIEAIQNLYRPSIKSLDTLYKDFIFTYKDDSKVYSKEESKYKKRDAPLFWSVLIIEAPVYKDLKSYQAFVKSQQPSINYPAHWSTAMIGLYEKTWLTYRQKEGGFNRRLKPKSIQNQVDELALLSESELSACISKSISNGYQGLFPPPRQTPVIPINGSVKKAMVY